MDPSLMVLFGRATHLKSFAHQMKYGKGRLTASAILSTIAIWASTEYTPQAQLQRARAGAATGGTAKYLRVMHIK